LRLAAACPVRRLNNSYCRHLPFAKAITVLLGELRPLNGETAQSSSDSSPARPCRRAEGNYLQL
jgi:hypothetical protein